MKPNIFMSSVVLTLSNLVRDGTICMKTFVMNQRDTMKYFEKSPARLHKFVEIYRSLGLEIGWHLTPSCLHKVEFDLQDAENWLTI